MDKNSKRIAWNANILPIYWFCCSSFVAWLDQGSKKDVMNYIKMPSILNWMNVAATMNENDTQMGDEDTKGEFCNAWIISKWSVEFLSSKKSHLSA